MRLGVPYDPFFLPMTRRLIGMNMRRLFAVMVVSAVASLSLVGVAGAQTPTQDAYGGVLGGQVSGGSGHGTTEFQASSSGSLPFTGADLKLAALLGLGLIGSGLVLRRASARRAA
jgi:hypothetical protein